MPAPIPVTSSGLRQAMRDRRYWQPGHPGRAGRQAWVSDGWRRLAKGGSGGDGVVWVAPHTRHRDGEAQEASGHYRHAGRGAMPPDGGDRTRRRVRTAEQDLPDGGRRVTVRDADGGLIGQCDSLADGSQICTLGLPDGRVVVQEFAAQGGEIVPVGGPLAVPAIVEAAPLFMAATALFRQLNERRRRASAELGDAGGDYTPVLILNRGFEGTAAGVRVAVGQLSPDRVHEFCPKTGEFDELLASVAAATPGEGMTAQQRGTAIHTAVRDALVATYPDRNGAVRTELSLIGGGIASYGQAGSTRLDILHHVEGTDTICAYDIKTGMAELRGMQAGRIDQEARDFGLQRQVPNPQVLVIELRAPR